MITRIELVNFMSHERTVIEPAAGLTVLVGPNNIGKSAIVTALQILCHNEPSKFARRHGTRECSVTVQTDDGHTIEWKRKDAPSYLIDGQKFDRLRSGLPEELHKALRLDKVDHKGNAEFDIHFGTQKLPIFLLDESEAKAARFFASSSDVIQLVAMQKRHKEKQTEAKRDVRRLETEAEKVQRELETLEPVIALQSVVEKVEQQATELQHREEQIAALSRDLSQLIECGRKVRQFQTENDALNTLHLPPSMAKTDYLDSLIWDLNCERAACELGSARRTALRELQSPPELEEENSFSDLQGELRSALQKVNQVESRVAALTNLAEPPAQQNDREIWQVVQRMHGQMIAVERYQSERDLIDTISPLDVEEAPTSMEQLISEWNNAIQRQRKWQSQIAELQGELEIVALDLRRFASESECPVCGGALDPDRIVERAAAGLGSHDHA